MCAALPCLRDPPCLRISYSNTGRWRGPLLAASVAAAPISRCSLTAPPCFGKSPQMYKEELESYLKRRTTTRYRLTGGLGMFGGDEWGETAPPNAF